MTFRMLFGLAISSGLALGVLKLFGFPSGAATPFEIGAGILMAVMYFGAFRSAVTGRTGKNETIEKERTVGEEVEAGSGELLQRAA